MKRNRKPAKPGSHVVHPNVSRVDYEQNHGYAVRIQRKGKETNKLFSDSIYGSQREAKRAAIAWREQMVAQLGAVQKGSHGPAKPPGYSWIKRREVPRWQSGVQHMVLCWGRLSADREP